LLNSSLIESPSAASAAPPRTSRVSNQAEQAPAKSAPRREIRSVPASDLSVGRPGSRSPEPDVDAPIRPTYRVQAHDTLRGIAKQTLGDARRDREILELNRGVITDPRRLVPGQTIVLPEDAVIATRIR